MKKRIIGIIGLSMLLSLAACGQAAAGNGNAPADPAGETEIEAGVPDAADTEGTWSTVPPQSDGQKNRSKKNRGESSGKSGKSGKSKDRKDRKDGGQKPEGNAGRGSGKKHGDGKKSGTNNDKESGDGAALVLQDGDALTGGTYTAEDADQSAMEASGTVSASVTGAVLNKTSGGASDADAASFRGVNAGVRVYGDANVTLTGCTVNASAKNATGVFAYENGVITMDDCTVTVTGGGAGGVQVAGGGTLYGTNLTVTSASKAAIRSDRGGGTMVLDGGTYTSTGSDGCPAIYSTAEITVKNAECVSTNSRAVIIEGNNSVTLENCTLSGNDQSTKEGSVKANVLLYQSASGDASVGTSAFCMTGGSMKANTGAMFYCTNTASVITLNGADLELSDDGTLLIVSAGRWGRDGKNGGDCTMNAKNQILTGTIAVDAISKLTVNLTEGSSFTGAVGGEGEIRVSLDAASTWTLTGDSYVTSFTGDPSRIVSNGYTLYVNGVALSGTK